MNTVSISVFNTKVFGLDKPVEVQAPPGHIGFSNWTSEDLLRNVLFHQKKDPTAVLVRSLQDEVLEWLSQLSYQPHLNFDYENSCLEFSFAESQDAIWFKLKWAGI